MTGIRVMVFGVLLAIAVVLVSMQAAGFRVQASELAGGGGDPYQGNSTIYACPSDGYGEILVGYLGGESWWYRQCVWATGGTYAKRIDSFWKAEERSGAPQDTIPFYEGETVLINRGGIAYYGNAQIGGPCFFMRAKLRGAGTGIEVSPSGRKLEGVDYCRGKTVPPPAEDFLPHGVTFKARDWASCWNQYAVAKFPECLKLPDEAKLVSALYWDFPFVPIPQSPKGEVLLAKEVAGWCVNGYCNSNRFAQVTGTSVGIKPGTGLVISLAPKTWAVYSGGILASTRERHWTVAYGPAAIYVEEGEIMPN